MSAGIQPARADIEQWITDAEQAFNDADPYRRQDGYARAARAYRTLASQLNDATLKLACNLAADKYDDVAARIRWEHGIPTIFPRTELGRLVLGTCDHCGRPWQADLEGACEHCPRLLFGPTPSSREEAAQFPPASTVEPKRWTHDGPPD